MRRASQSTFVSFFLLAFIAFAFNAACSRAGGEANRGDAAAVAATVNGKNISLGEVDRIINQQLQGQQNRLSQLELAQARLQALDGLIQDEVLYQRAEKEKLLPADDEVNQTINNLKQQSGMTDEDFQKNLKEANLTLEGLRDTQRKVLAIQKLRDRVDSKITVSDKEVEDFYNNNKQQFVNARGVALANIVVDPSDNGLQNDAKGDADATQKIQRLYQRLKGGADFATVAREESEDPTSAARGGDIGFAAETDLKQNGFPQELVNQLFGPMQIGDITAPVKFPNGRWYIFKLQRKQLQNENLTLDSPGVRQQITQAIHDQRKQVLNQALLESALYDSKITNTLAQSMLNNPGSMSGLHPAQPAASPNASGANQSSAKPTPAQTPAATGAASPRPAASPAR